MDALRRSQQGLCKAVRQYGNNAVKIGSALNAVGHAGLFKGYKIAGNGYPLEPLRRGLFAFYGAQWNRAELC